MLDKEVLSEHFNCLNQLIPVHLLGTRQKPVQSHLFTDRWLKTTDCLLFRMHRLNANSKLVLSQSCYQSKKCSGIHNFWE